MRRAHLVGGADRDGRLRHHHLGLGHVLGDGGGHREHVLQIRRAVLVGRRAHGDELDAAVRHPLGGVGGEAEPAPRRGCAGRSPRARARRSGSAPPSAAPPCPRPRRRRARRGRPRPAPTPCTSPTYPVPKTVIFKAASPLEVVTRSGPQGKIPGRLARPGHGPARCPPSPRWSPSSRARARPCPPPARAGRCPRRPRRISRAVSTAIGSRSEPAASSVIATTSAMLFSVALPMLNTSPIASGLVAARMVPSMASSM